MTTILQAIILGIVQGLTEWLPVSSSGHLVIVQHFLGISPPILFNVMLHVGTLLVIFVVFWNDIKKIIISLFNKDKAYAQYRKLALFIVIGSIPTALIGYFFRDFFASLFNITSVSIMLLITGLLLWTAESVKTKKKELTPTDSFLVGIMQGIAIIPGISRSGATISMGLFRGVNRDTAAKFSFLLAVPAILGATVFEFKNISAIENLPAMIIGTVFAAVIGYLSLKLLLSLVHQKKLRIFSYYCWAVGIILLVFSLISTTPI